MAHAVIVYARAWALPWRVAHSPPQARLLNYWRSNKGGVRFKTLIPPWRREGVQYGRVLNLKTGHPVEEERPFHFISLFSPARTPTLL